MPGPEFEPTTSVSNRQRTRLHAFHLASTTVVNCTNKFSLPLRLYLSQILLISASGRDSSVGIATRYGLDGPGIESRWGARFSVPVQTCPGAHPASCTMGTGSFPGVKRPGRGVDHAPPSSVSRS